MVALFLYLEHVNWIKIGVICSSCLIMSIDQSGEILRVFMVIEMLRLFVAVFRLFLRKIDMRKSSRTNCLHLTLSKVLGKIRIN